VDEDATNALKTRFLPKFPNVEMLQLVGGADVTEEIKVEEYRTVCSKLKTVIATDDEDPEPEECTGMRPRILLATKQQRKL